MQKMTNDRTRKTAIRARMLTTGEVFSIAARYIDALSSVSPTPAQAFMKSFGKKNFTEDNLQEVLPRWVAGVYLFTTSAWEGETDLLEDLGKAYKELEEKGYELRYNYHTIDFLLRWFANQTLHFSSEKLGEVYAKNSDLLNTNMASSEFAQEFAPNATNNYTVLMKVGSLLRSDLATAENSELYTTDGVVALTLIWGILPQHARNYLAFHLALLIRTEFEPWEEASS